MENFNFEPIGFFEGPYKNKYDSPRQSPENQNPALGKVVLQKGFNLEQGLKGLEGFERIWLIYCFHENQGWRPLTQTPRDTEKQGVFATRAPYRPNPIGMSCVKIERLEKNILWVSEFDLLDQTPILDIKPYVPSCDRFDVVNASWIEEENKKEVLFEDLADEQLQWLESQGLQAVRGALVDQLSRDPVNSKKKRVQRVEENLFELSYRTWRVDFYWQGEEVQIVRLRSGYTFEDLKKEEDFYQDKEVHRKFRERYKN